MKFRPLLTTVCVCVLATILAGCGKRQEEGGPGASGAGGTAAAGPKGLGGSPETAIMANADLVLTADLKSMRAAPIYQTLEALAKEKEQTVKDTRPELNDFTKLAEQLEAIAGLTMKDYDKLTLAAALGKVDFAADEPPEPEDIDVALGVSLAKPLTLETLREVIKQLQEAEDLELAVRSATHQNTDLLVAKDTSEGTEQDVEIGMTMIESETVFIGGFLPDVKAAMDRAAAGQTAELAANLKKLQDGMQPGTQLSCLFSFPEALRERIRTEAAKSAAAGQMQAQALMAMRSMTGLALSVAMDETLSVRLSAVLGSPEDATQLRSIVDTMVISGAKMGLSMMLGGKPVPMLESLRAEATPDGVVTVSAAVTVDDIQILQTLGSQKGQR